MLHNNRSTTTDHRFTGKERQSKVDNSIYDSFARFQNTYGRFMSIDPKAEEFYHISPYTYCAGDPVNLVDPDGEIPILPILWAAYEVGSAIYDVYTTYSTLVDENATTKDKIIAAGGLAASAILPGGGYTLFSKADDVDRVVKTTDKVVDSKRAVANGKTLQEHAKIGQEAHRQIEKELKETVGAKIEQRVKIGDNYVRKDAVLPDDTYVIYSNRASSSQKNENNLCMIMVIKHKLCFMTLMIQNICQDQAHTLGLKRNKIDEYETYKTKID